MYPSAISLPGLTHPSEERIALTRAIDFAREAIEAKHRPDGYNIGINCGDAAGQTVFHLHVHVIPRYRGDVPDPRGGVRHVIPSRGNYLSGLTSDHNDASISERVLITGAEDPLLPLLKHHLTESDSVDIAVAFTMRSGLELIHPYLAELLSRGGRLRILTGDYLDTTDPDALLLLLDLDGNIERRVYETRGIPGFSPVRPFHPKAYVFHHRDGSGAAFVGSSNLSAAALTFAVEWNYRIISSRDVAGFVEVEEAFETLFHSPATVELTQEWVTDYSQPPCPPDPRGGGGIFLSHGALTSLNSARGAAGLECDQRAGAQGRTRSAGHRFGENLAQRIRLSFL